MPSLFIHSASDDVCLEVSTGQSVRDILDTTALRVRAACGGTGACGACVVRLIKGAVNSHTLAEYQKLTTVQRSEGLRLACQLRLSGDAEIRVDHPAPPSAWKSIQPEDLIPRAEKLPNLDRHIYGLAVDLGTTNIRLSFWDRKYGRRIASRSGPNPQVVFGADILNRLEYARSKPEHAIELSRLARNAIVQAVHDILARDVGEVRPMLTEIGQIIVVGNTAMLALLTGNGLEGLLNPENWQRPIDIAPENFESFQAGWFMPNATVTILPPLAGFVGSDLLADIVATDFGHERLPELLIDVGTNNEIALWDGQRLHVTSVPGGPAFEAVGIRHGMAAEKGAIFRVERQKNDFSCKVIGGGEASGLCGSGLVDAIAVLLEDGTVKPSGRFKEPPGPGGFALLPENECSAVAPGDIDAFQRAKAATASAMALLLDEAGLNWESLSRVCICGAFGHMLDIGHARAVGLLPPVAPGRIELYADASLAGCERSLLSDNGGEGLYRLARTARLINLSYAKRYDDYYIAHLRLEPIPASGTGGISHV